jgi:hypothetical protein
VRAARFLRAAPTVAGRTSLIWLRCHPTTCWSMWLQASFTTGDDFARFITANLERNPAARAAGAPGR